MEEYISQEQKELLQTGTIVRIKSPKENSVYYFLPFWFKATKDERVFERISLENLPDSLKEQIEFSRNLAESRKKEK